MTSHELVYFRLRGHLADLMKAVEATRIGFDNLGGLGLVMRTPALKTKWDEFKKAELPLQTILDKVDHARIHRDDELSSVEEEFQETLKPLRKATIEFRTAVENFVF